MSHDPRPAHFVIAGAQRSGTTLLYRLLAEHPEITMAAPEQPEPKFFLREDAVELGLEGYQRHFPIGARTSVRGEKSTSYIESEAAARHIRAVLPDARLVFVLRDPVERALSNYRFSVAHGVETADMAEAFLKEDSRRGHYDRERFSVSPFAYLERGMYVRHLDAYRRHFPRERMKLLLFERLIAGEEDLAGLLSFLGVSDDGVPDLPARPVNASPPAPDGEPSDSLRRYLAEVFREPNRELARRYDLDLSRWPSATAETRQKAETR